MRRYSKGSKIVAKARKGMFFKKKKPYIPKRKRYVRSFKKRFPSDILKQILSYVPKQYPKKYNNYKWSKPKKFY